MVDIIVIVIITGIIGLAANKIRLDKKKGVKCAGCPYAQSGDSNCHCNH